MTWLAFKVVAWCVAIPLGLAVFYFSFGEKTDLRTAQRFPSSLASRPHHLRS